MARVTIDLSGKGGLAPKFYGDVNRTTGDPNRRYVGSDGQIADGVYNPLVRFGYISPSNGAAKGVTLDSGGTTISGVVRAAVYDQIQNVTVLGFDSYLAKASGSKAVDFTTSSQTFSNISDLEFYTINGSRYLFVLTDAAVSIWDLIDDTCALNWSSTTPVSSGATVSTSLTTSVVVGANQATPYASSGALFVAGKLVQYSSRNTDTFTLSNGGAKAPTSASTPQTVYAAGPVGASTFTTWSYNRFCLADNGYLYVLNKNRVHKIDGTTSGGGAGTLTADVLVTPVNWVFYDAVDTRGLMMIAMNQLDSNNNMRNQPSTTFSPVLCGVYVWDRLTTITNVRDFIPLTGYKEIRRIFVSHTGEVRVIAVGTNRTTSILRFTGSSFEPIEDLGEQAYPMQWGSLVVGTNCTYWLGFDGFLYGYGGSTTNKKEDPEKLFKLTDVNAIATAAHSGQQGIFRAGACLLTNSSYTVSSGYDDTLENIYMSYAYTNSLGSTAFDMVKYIPNTVDIQDGVTPVASQGNIYSLVKRLPVFSTINFIRIYNLPISSSGSSTVATVKVYYNQSSTPAETHTVTQKEANAGYVYIASGFNNAYAVQIKIEFATSAQLGVDDYCPIYAEVDYTDLSVTPTGSSGKQR